MRTIITIILFSLLLAGCEQRLTKEEWMKTWPAPTTIGQAQAMATLETELLLAKAKVSSLESLDKFKIMCAIGAVASIFAIALGVKSIGAAGLIACLGGFVLAFAGSEYAKWVGVVGLVMGVAAGVYATYIIIVAIKQVVTGNEKFKIDVDNSVVAKFKEAQKKIQNSSTAKIVGKIIKNGGTEKPIIT